MTKATDLNIPAEIDLFTLERDVRQMRAAEMARLGRSLRAWLVSLMPGDFEISTKHA